ncbi:MAG: NIPSNAP family protein [Hyphomicrobiaceae bacterium]
MIYEMRTYTTPAGKAPVLANLSAEIAREIRGDDYGKLEGYWVTEVGPLNKCMHLWSYDDLGHREARRGALSQNDRWRNEYLPQALPLILRQDIRLMTAARPLAPPATTGNTYEFRYYRCKVGKAAQFTQLLLEALPGRERFSKNVCVWNTMAGQPNEVCHMWAYDSLDRRAEIRAAALDDPDWQGLLANVHPLIDEMDNMLITPWTQSPLK